ncbi:MAG: ATP-binding protein, partial [Anaerolineae bacterium]|nr:ATP-binding protein [Anaerolineae bacterium]
MGEQDGSTWGGILKRRARDRFVGREKERDVFQRNLEMETPECLLFWIYGLAGIGKSFLVARFREMAGADGAATALTNEAEWAGGREQSIVNAMGRLARELREAGAPLPAFEKRFEKYRECMQEIEADPEAPTGAFELLGRTAARVALGAAKTTAVGTMAGGLLAGSGMEEGLVDQAGQWAGYVARRFKNKDEVALVKDPVRVLTPLFVEGVNGLGERTVVLCFDTWERTGEHLGAWLRGQVLEEGLSSRVRVVVAGRHEPRDDWEPFDSVMMCSELEAFTEGETREYLARQGIEEEGRIGQILDFSRGVPVLVSTLASAKGGSATDAAHGLVDRYLKWVDDRERREGVLACAAARWFDRDVVGQVLLPHEDVDAGGVFDWLVSMPFVQSRPGYWEYHPTVRRLMLAYVRDRSRRESRAAHARLWRYHRDRMMERGEGERYEDGEWRRHRVEVLYQRLMEVGDGAVAEGLEGFVGALRGYYSLTGEIVAAWGQAAEEQPDEAKVNEWNRRLQAGWAAIEAEDWGEALALPEALQSFQPLPENARRETFFLAGGLRHAMGRVHAARGEHDEALELYGRALALKEQAGEVREQGVTLHAMGDVHQARGEDDEALELYGRALALKEQAGDARGQGITLY